MTACGYLPLHWAGSAATAGTPVSPRSCWRSVALINEDWGTVPGWGERGVREGRWVEVGGRGGEHMVLVELRLLG